MKKFLLMLLSEVGHPVFSTIVELIESELENVLQSMTDAHPEAARGMAFETDPEAPISIDAQPAADVESAVI